MMNTRKDEEWRGQGRTKRDRLDSWEVMAGLAIHDVTINSTYDFVQ